VRVDARTGYFIPGRDGMGAGWAWKNLQPPSPPPSLGGRGGVPEEKVMKSIQISHSWGVFIQKSFFLRIILDSGPTTDFGHLETFP
jgi:hypothetical protein